MNRLVISSLSLAVLFACGPAAQPVVCTAEVYPDENYATNAAAELELRTRFETLIEKMETASTARPTAAEMEALFIAGTPSLSDLSTDAARVGIREAFAKTELAAATPWAPADPPVGYGGLYGTHVYNERGVDLPETVEKLLLGGMQYMETARLMKDTATVADIDRMVALFGASPSFPMDDKAAVDPDVMVAKYAKKRTNPEAAIPGPYLAIKRAFMNARASVKGGSACAQQRTEAFAQIREQWERVLLGTTVYYLNTAGNTLARATPTTAEQAGALHQIGEALGFLRGLKALPAEHRIIADAQLDQVLTTLGGTALASAEAYKYITAPNATLDKLALAVTQIQAARQFTREEIATFKESY